MRLICALGVLVLLTGCAKPVWETVDDEVTVLPTALWQETAYEIQLGLPQGLELVEQTENRCFYGVDADGLEVETCRFLAADCDSAIRAVSGFEAEELTILQTRRFDLPEYQFAWVAQTEQGSRLYRADLILDEMDCYAVICSRPEQAGTTLDQEISQVFSTFGLYVDEGI